MSTDILHWPILGPFLHWRHARTIMQIPVFLLAALMIFDGLVGPQLAPKNLATVGTWLHYRGLVALALLVAGNLFCMACPFMLPRQGARWLRERFLGGGRMLPAALRNKWPATALVVLFFFAYEYFDLWASPWLTAWIAVGYFLAALLVDTFLVGASFCKHICPLGQFNFFGSLVSPLEIRVREASACAACHTKDCITGRDSTTETRKTRREENGTDLRASVVPLRGCELWLFQQRKAGNMDCTFCLDCVHACPYDNVGIIPRIPAAELWIDPYRSGIGRFSRRFDLALLVGVFVFGAYLNAFGMIKPVYAIQERLMGFFRSQSQAPGLIFLFLLGLVVLPALLVGGAALTSRALGGLQSWPPWPRLASRYIYALAPMGFAMWLAHYSFHFLSGGLTIVPVIQSFLADVGLPLGGGAPRWGLGPLAPAGMFYPVEAFLLYLGAAGSLATAFQMARHDVGDSGPENRALVIGAAAPWMALVVLLLGAGLWILVQPMEMRGTMMMLTAPGGAP